MGRQRTPGFVMSVVVIFGVFLPSFVTSQCPAPCTCPDRHQVICIGKSLVNFPATIPESARVLRLDGNNVRKITKLHASYRNLHALTVVNNSISDIEDESFTELSNLTQLSLSINKISDLREKMFAGLKSLNRLDIDDNDITELHANDFSPGSLPFIEKVNLENNFISSMENKVFGTKNDHVRELRLSGNKLTLVPSPDFLKTLPSLRKLELNRNTEISSVPDSSFSNLNNLEYLNLDSCGITSITRLSFTGLSSVKELRLGHNSISDVPLGGFGGMTALRKLILHNNKLQTLPQDRLPLSQMSELSLEQNPWVCDCSIVWMQDAGRLLKQANVTCASPEKLAGQIVTRIPREELRCSSSGRNMSLILAVVIPILVVLILMLVVTIYCLISRRQKDDRNDVRYSAVYKETVEKRPQRDENSPARPVSEL